MTGTVILYIRGREYTRKSYHSKPERRAIIAQWREDFHTIDSIGIIPNVTGNPRTLTRNEMAARRLLQID